MSNSNDSMRVKSNDYLADNGGKSNENTDDNELSNSITRIINENTSENECDASVSISHSDDEPTSVLQNLDEVDVAEEVDEIWRYRSGFAYNETQKEYAILQAFLEMGRGRSYVYLSRIYGTPIPKLNKIRDKNNWDQRIDAYDRQTLVNTLSDEEKTRRVLHEQKLEMYRGQLEVIASQSAGNASKILHLIQKKLNTILESGDNLSVDELVSTGNLAVKLSQLHKEVGGQALGVEALLEAIDDDES